MGPNAAISTKMCLRCRAVKPHEDFRLVNQRVGRICTECLTARFKVCKKCGDTFPVNRFHRPNRYKSQHATYCKRCHNAAMSVWIGKMTPEERRARNRKYYERNISTRKERCDALFANYIAFLREEPAESEKTTMEVNEVAYGGRDQGNRLSKEDKNVLEDEIAMIVGNNPGISQSKIAARASRSRDVVVQSLIRLTKRGRIVLEISEAGNMARAKRYRYYLPGMHEAAA